MKDIKTQQMKAILLSVLAAVFYAVSTPVSKILLGHSDPNMLASCLYFGAGTGIGIIYLFRRKKIEKAKRLGRSDLPYIIGMIVLDILALVLMMKGIEVTAAANVSLLSNFEIVATALFAFFLFHEKVSPKMWAALALITISSAILSFEGSASFGFSRGSLMVLCASLCWGLENNCTKRISSKSTYEIVIIKGIFSGTGLLVIAMAEKEKIPSFAVIACAFALGFVSYGLSIFTYIRAQNIIGAAKTSAFYALTPFIGAFLSFIFLRENLSKMYFIGLAIMIAGSFIAVTDTLGYSLFHAGNNRGHSGD